MMRFSIPDMSCGHCQAAVEEAMQALDAQAMVNVDLTAKIVDVDTSKSEAEVLAALDRAGYPARVTPTG